VSGPVHRTELSPVSFLDRSARVFPDRTAVVHGTRRYSYAELATRCRRLAGALRAAGLARGDRVALLCPNTPAMLEAHFGVPLAGGVMVPINVRLTAPEIGYILGHSGARFLLVDAALIGSLEGLDLTGLQVVWVDDTGVAGDPYEDLLATGDPSGPRDAGPDDEDALISINYTSGTTGRPKGVMCTHRGSHLNALGDVLDNGLTDGTVYLWTLPMFHGNGWCFTWAVTAVGGTHVCLRSPDPARIWDLLEAEQVTHMCSAPTVQIGVAHHPAAHRGRPLGRATEIGVHDRGPARVGEHVHLGSAGLCLDRGDEAVEVGDRDVVGGVAGVVLVGEQPVLGEAVGCEAHRVGLELLRRARAAVHEDHRRRLRLCRRLTGEAEAEGDRRDQDSEQAQ